MTRDRDAASPAGSDGPEPSSARRPVLLLQADAPAKPAVGQPCNGCGVCCAWQPCPLGMVVSRRRYGACTALRWDPGARRYHCAMVAAPQSVWPWWPRALRVPLTALARRWIASGQGCDCTLEVEPGPPHGRPADTDAGRPGQP